MCMKPFRFSKRHRNLLLGATGCLGLVLVFSILARMGIGIPCLFHRLTGLSCPGCGNSRAALALMQLDLAGALGHNLLFPVEFFYIGWVLFHTCRSYLRGKGFSYRPPLPWLDLATLILVVLWWVLRNLMGI